MVHSCLQKNHSDRLVIPLFLALSFLGGSMPRGELWEILRSYQPFNSCRTNDRVNGIQERERIFPQTPESWQFGNCGGRRMPRVTLGGRSGGTIVMGAHARNSWGAIDPEPRPPLSPVPPRTMAGAFYPKSAGPPFSQTTSATTS